MGWKEEEVTGRRVQECKGLSAKPADKTDQNKPEREFLENGENAEIRKIRNNKQKSKKTRISQRSRQMWENKTTRSEKAKSKTKLLKQKPW